ncbi:putative gp7 protein [Enterobacteriaceae bacterium ATCC 29904]|nr:putative gp7 protein [Enterobacteriaceae bacterium ATCC 29904]
MPMQVNITTKVNSKSIRRETHNGREHLVLPSYTLPANVVMNGGLYTEDEINAHYQGLEGTLAPLGHPQVNGQFVSAFSPEGLCTGFVGAWNRNVKKSGNRIYVEKWVDVARAEESEGGRELLERVAAIERGDDVPPIHTSVAAFLDQLEPNEQQRATGADWVAKIHSMDHDAILLHEVGAATPEQGVGLMVNADLAQPLKANSGALVGESYREREQLLDRAAKAKFASGPDEYAWVADFTDSQAVIIRNGGNAEVFGYKSEGGAITFDDTGTAVARQESWVTVVANKFKSLFTPQEQPAQNHKTEGDMPLTTEEKQELISEIGKGLAANFADALNPIKDAITGLQANQDKLTETLTANSRAEEKAKRDAVAAKHGDVVANSLSGDALDVMFKSLGEAAPLGTNNAQQHKETGAPDPKTYFGGAA